MTEREETTLGAPLLGARTVDVERTRGLEEGTGTQYAHRRRMFMSGRDRDLEAAQQAEARDQLSDWAQMLRSLSRTRRGAADAADAADADAADASRRALQTATRAGFHRARVDLYEGSNLDTPENELSRTAAASRSSMGRAATIAVRWVLVVLIVLAAVLVAFGIHECSRWGQHATRLATELAYSKSGVCVPSPLCFHPALFDPQSTTEKELGCNCHVHGCRHALCCRCWTHHVAPQSHPQGRRQ